jgi:signal transduction histidine kinase
MRRFPGVALELSADGVVRTSNGRLDALVGRELAGVALADVLDSSSQTKWKRILSGPEAVNPACTWELVIVTPSSLEIRTFHALWGSHPPSSVLWLLEQAVDSRTERLYVELAALNRELVGAQREISRERKRLRRALDKAEAAIRSRDEMLAIVSHDLRTPIGTIAMTAELLEMSRLDEDVAQQVALIRKTASSTIHLIADLIDVSAIESGKLSVELEPLSLRPLLEETCRMLAAQADEKHQRLHVAADRDIPPVSGDRDRILQVLSNLVGNAIKFTPREGVITLNAASADGEVLVSVEDTGPGIPASDVPHVFDRFWHTSRKQRGGAGLGLATAKGIVEAHGGRIGVETHPGRGSTFFFTLRVASER